MILAGFGGNALQGSRFSRYRMVCAGLDQNFRFVSGWREKDRLIMLE
uniref:Uncharacterized protein n=1 Tax=Picea glauca TaxID=3330 RepID=A0A117NHF0_PICGL|nr:hypothetical protein ABT39_MTgene5275 [Picea glauca]QHR88850.1 hypothetical protein Q903MT_gene2869 [Picea sitchensis]